MDHAQDPRPLRVLALTRTNPARHQTWKLRVELLMPHLAQHNIQVDARWFPVERRAKSAFLAALPRYDLLWLHRYITWPWELARLRGVADRLVLDVDDPVGMSSSNFANFSLTRCLKFRATARGVDAVLAASDGLVALASAHQRNTTLVRLCADPASHSMTARPRGADEPLRLLWLGSRSTFKYLEQVRPHLEAIGRGGRPIELVVVGHQTLQLAQLRVHNLAWSPEAEREQFARCHVGLVPAADDRWTRAKATLKPLQYLANGMPFIASPVGVNVRIADEERNGILASTPEQWAAAAARLEADEATRRGMGQRGIAYIRAHHSPEVLADQVAHVFRALTSTVRASRDRSVA